MAESSGISHDFLWQLEQLIKLQYFVNTRCKKCSTKPVKEKNEKVIGLMNDELGGQIMKEFVGTRAKTYSYLQDNNGIDKKQKAQKNVSYKENLNFKTIGTV